MYELNNQNPFEIPKNPRLSWLEGTRSIESKYNIFKKPEQSL